MRRRLNEDTVEIVVTRDRFCARCGLVTSWAHDGDNVWRCIHFRDGMDEPCLLTLADRLSDVEQGRLEAYVARTEPVVRYQFI